MNASRAGWYVHHAQGEQWKCALSPSVSAHLAPMRCLAARTSLRTRPRAWPQVRVSAQYVVVEFTHLSAANEGALEACATVAISTGKGAEDSEKCTQFQKAQQTHPASP